MAPVAKRLTISLAGSTSSIGMGLAACLSFEQAAQRAELAVLLVDQVRVFLESLRVVLPHGMLELADGERIQQVIFAAHAVLIVAADGQFGVVAGDRLEGLLVLHLRFAREHVQADAFDARGRAGEVLVDQGFVQADGFEDLRAAIALQRRDAHLGKGLQQAFVDGFDVVDAVRREPESRQLRVFSVSKARYGLTALAP